MLVLFLNTLCIEGYLQVNRDLMLEVLLTILILKSTSRMFYHKTGAPSTHTHTHTHTHTRTHMCSCVSVCVAGSLFLSLSLSLYIYIYIYIYIHIIKVFRNNDLCHKYLRLSITLIANALNSVVNIIQ